MNKPKQCIIIGGGFSVKEGVEKGLWEKIKGKFVIGINHSFEFFPDHTFLAFVDNHFFEHKTLKGTKVFSELKKESLLITKDHPSKYMLPNMVILKTTGEYDRNLINKKVYKGALTGIYSLTLAINLIDEGEVFLLGYDFCGIGTTDQKKNKVATTHWYQGKLHHKGIGKISYYRTKGRPENDFKPYVNEKKVKIYNVSMNSKIPYFEKITYDQFFQKLDNKTYNQNELRKWVVEKFGGYYEKKK